MNPQYRFFEPKSDIKITPELVFIPGLAFDINGYRIGFGKGHYDKYFANKVQLGYKFLLIGVCCNMQTYIPREIHDIKMDYIIFNQNILKL